MHKRQTILEHAQQRGVSRRAFIKYCAVTASLLALPGSKFSWFREALAAAPRPSVIWLSFQECTGCTESLTRSFEPTLENLIFDELSLDYHHTLQAAAGTAAEAARHQAMEQHFGQYVVVVDGSIPTDINGAYSAIAGQSNIQMLAETVSGAALVVAVGTCASFGGLPHADPNPTGAASVDELMNQSLVESRPLVNVSGCPPVPEVISGVIAYYLTHGALPELDVFKRPLVFFGETVHDRCNRLAHFNAGRFAKSFDDEGARQGYCLLELGCKGPDTRNACSRLQWNGGTSYPMHSGHGCLGCAEPDFWDRGSFYQPLG